MFDTFTVVIPHLPDKELSANASSSHGHWAQRSRPRKEARGEARQEARAQLGAVAPAVSGRAIRVQIYAHTTKSKWLDADNAMVAVKSYLDGIFDYLEANDQTIEAIGLLRRLSQPQDRMIFVFMDAEAFDDQG